MNGEPRFFGFLKQRIGLDAVSIGPALIERAVRQRCQATGMPDDDAYWHLLQGSAPEQQALIESVIVPETWFFRYPESFVTFARLAAEQLARLAGARPLRIVSLPCSTGEEPCSLAMALLDAGIAPSQFCIDAVDISPLSIERAQRGHYGRNSFRGDRLAFRDRHFSGQGSDYLISERVRAQVNFQTGNLLDPRLALLRDRYDFVFCRNLLIYFDLDTQRRALSVLIGMTRDDGVLFIGPAEGSLLSELGMRGIGVAQSFAFSRQPPRRSEPVSRAPAASQAPPAIARPIPRAPQPPAPPPRSRPTLVPPDTSREVDAERLLANIASLANAGRSNEARAACEQYLRRFEPVAAVFYWQGLLAEVSGNLGAAQGFYRKALYLEPQHLDTLMQLASLLAAQGDADGARRLRQRATRGSDKEGRTR